MDEYGREEDTEAEDTNGHIAGYESRVRRISFPCVQVAVFLQHGATTSPDGVGQRPTPRGDTSRDTWRHVT